jgi:RHS repeat-associated protein
MMASLMSAQLLSGFQFTGKERDAETGLDFFGARYMSAVQGRWSSPDVVNLTAERLVSPSSTLNKYAYGGNNPLRFIDPDGRDIVALHDHRAPAGRFMLVAYNQKTGDFAIESFGPAQHMDPRMVLPGGAPGQEAYNLPTSLEDLKNNYAALTIQTSPEVAQDAIQEIRERGAGPYQVFTRNCTSACTEVLEKVGLVPGFLPPDPPGRLWDYLFRRYSPNMKRIPKGAASVFRYGPTPSTPGNDYGSPRHGTGYDGYTFRHLWDLLNRPVTGCVSVSDSATGTKSTPECK